MQSKSICTISCFMFIFLSLAAPLTAAEPLEKKVSGDIYLRMPEFNYHLSMENEVKYVLDAKAKASISVMPFRGIDTRDKRGVFKLNNRWFEDQSREILDFYLKHAGEDLFKPEKKKPYYLLFLCRAFIKELDESYDGKKGFKDYDSLLEKVKNKYMDQALMYAGKYKVQSRVKNPPRFKSLVKVLQPMMSVFMYGDPWIAMGECFRTSDKFSRGKEIYRNYFLNVEVMTVIRRRYRVDASERNLSASILKMSDDVFYEYQRECSRRWVDERQYKISKIEKAKKVKDIPKELSGPEVTNRLP